MNKLKRHLNYYKLGLKLSFNPYFLSVKAKTELEYQKKPSRTEIINFLISKLNRKTYYLEIGVSNPENNFNNINASVKYSVDPGIEYNDNPVNFKMTSDDFFLKLKENKILSDSIKFDVIFIDGLHLAEQVDRDISNAFNYLNENGYIVLHDCNPPTEWHSREDCYFYFSPAERNWNGTTWKAFMKWRFNPVVNSCCINTDWGIGILSLKHPIGCSIEPVNPFYEFDIFDKNRKEHLNLIEFDEFKKIFES